MENLKSQENRKKVIITSLSYINKSVDYPFNDYKIENELYKCRHSNEPVFVYLSKELRDLENIKIIAFVSNEVQGAAGPEQDSVKSDEYTFHTDYYLDQKNGKLSDKGTEYKNTLDYYKKYLNIVFGFNTSDDSIICIPYNNEELNIEETIRILSKKLEPDTDLYIDISGGLRGYSTVLMSLCDYFSYRNIEIKEIISCVSPTNKTPGRVISTDIEEILDFSKAISRFVNDGNANKLNVRISNCSINDYSIIDNIKKYLINFSENILLIDLKEFDKHYKQLEMSLNAWEYLYNEKVNKKCKINVTDSCFYYSLKSIKTKLYMPEYDEKNIKDIGIEKYIKDIEQNGLNTNITNVEYEPSIRALKWCLDNNLIMQSLSIYEEKIPQLYLKYKVSYNEETDLVHTLLSKFDIQVEERDEKGKNPDQIFYKNQYKAKAVYDRLLRDFFKDNFFSRTGSQPIFDNRSSFDRRRLMNAIDSNDEYRLLKIIDNEKNTGNIFRDNFLSDIEKMHNGMLSGKKIKVICKEIVKDADFLIDSRDATNSKINTTYNIPLLSSSFGDIVKASCSDDLFRDISKFVKTNGCTQISIYLWRIYQEIVSMRNQVIHSNSIYISKFKDIKTKLKAALNITSYILKDMKSKNLTYNSDYSKDAKFINSINDWKRKMNFSSSDRDLARVNKEIERKIDVLKNSKDFCFDQGTYDYIAALIDEAFSLIEDDSKDWNRVEICKTISLSNKFHAYILQLPLDCETKGKVLDKFKNACSSSCS